MVEVHVSPNDVIADCDMSPKTFDVASDPSLAPTA